MKIHFDFLECLSAKKNEMIHIQGPDGNAYYRSKDDVTMKAEDAKAECERLETKMAGFTSEETIKGLFEALPRGHGTWIGMKLVNKDNTRMFQVIFNITYSGSLHIASCHSLVFANAVLILNI